jgi:KDO2-lipid IV(A) lauroyltransferase
MKKIEYYLVIFLFAVFKRLPFALVRYIGLMIAFITQHIIRYRTKLVKENLRRAFPDYDEQKIAQITRDVYINFSFLWTEWLQSWRFDKNFAKKNCVVENWEIVGETIAQNKGLVMYSGHLGNFEWIARYVQHYHGQVTGIMRRMHNKDINDFSIRIRKDLGFGVIYTDGAFQKTLELLANGSLIGVAGDQDAHEKGVFVDFFGIPSSTAVGAALFHLKSGAPIIFMAGIREKWGKFRFIFEKVPLPENKDITDDNIYRITQAATSLLEKYIRRYPGQYFWTHRRWKTVPDKFELE